MEEVTVETTEEMPERPGSRGPVRRSPVWTWFRFDKDSKKSFCVVAGCHYSVGGSHSSTLANHLRSHPVIYKEFLVTKEQAEVKAKNNDQKKRKLNEFGFVVTPTTGKSKFNHKWPSDDKRQQELEKKLGLMFGCSRIALNMITNEAFRDFIETGMPCFDLPKSRKKVTALVESVYHEMCVNIKRILANVASVNVVLDMWTQKGYTYSYVGIVVVFFCPASSALEAALIGVRSLNHPHTADRIRACVSKVLSEWDIRPDQVLRYLTDGASNMVAAYKYDEHVLLATNEEVESTSESDDERDGPSVVDPNLDATFDEDDDAARQIASYEDQVQQMEVVFPMRISCYIHQLMCALKNCVEKHDVVRELSRLTREVVKDFKKRSTAVQALAAKTDKAVLLPAKTRWNTLSLVLDRLLQIEKPFKDVCDDLSINSFDESDWERLKLLASLLQPFRKHTDAHQGSTKVTIDRVIPSLMQLDIGLAKNVYGQFNGLANDLRNELKERFAFVLDPNSPNFDRTFSLATTLSPALTLCLESAQLEAARKELKALVRAAMDDGDRVDEETPAASDDSQGEVVLATGNGLFDDVLSLVNSRRLQRSVDAVTSSSVSKADSLVNLYFQEATSDGPSSSSASAIDFWIQNMERYGKLADVALGIFSIPASTAMIERVFSVAGDVSERRRNRIRPKQLERETMLRFNKKFAL